MSRQNLFLPGLPAKKLLAAFGRAPGNEVESGKLTSPQSSAALAANTFGLFLEQPERLPKLPGLLGVDWPARSVDVEQCVRFPWRGGRHPWLDVVIRTDSHVVGVESKRYEPFRPREHSAWSSAYLRDVWGENMGAFEALRDELIESPGLYRHLDAAQLIKHAFALCTEAEKCKCDATLYYLYAEPMYWPEGKPVPPAARSGHAEEIANFVRRTQGALVSVVPCSYRTLLEKFALSPFEDVRAHAKRVEERFHP